MPGWVSSLLKLGATAAIAFYLVYTNQRMFENTLLKISETLGSHEDTSKKTLDTLKDHEGNADRARDAQLRLLRVICRNTATDVVQRANCDNN